MGGSYSLLVLGHEHGNWLTFKDKAQPTPEEQDGKTTEILRGLCGLFAYGPTVRP